MPVCIFFLYIYLFILPFSMESGILAGMSELVQEDFCCFVILATCFDLAAHLLSYEYVCLAWK